MSQRKGFLTMRDALDQYLNSIKQARNSNHHLIGIPSGFTVIDQVIQGWQKSTLIVVAGETAMGKTPFIYSLTLTAALNHHKSTLLFTPRATGFDVTNSFISIEAELERLKIKKGQLSDWEWEKLYTKVGAISEASIMIDDTPKLFIEDLVREAKQEQEVDLIVVDDIQVIRSKRPRPNREQEQAFVVKELKILARELEIPIIASSQLSRNMFARDENMRPLLHSLRDSGSIEDFADIVMFLYRPEYYGLTEDANGNSTKGITEVLIAKHSNGALADVLLRFISKYTKFEDLRVEHLPRKEPAEAFPDSQNTEFDIPPNITVTFDEYNEENEPNEHPIDKLMLLTFLILQPGTSAREPSYPSEWQQEIGQRVVLIGKEGYGRIISEGSNVEELIDGKTVYYNQLNIKEGCQPGQLFAGSVIEIKDSNGEIRVYRKEQEDSWVYLGEDINLLIEQGRAYVEKYLLTGEGKVLVYEHKKPLLIAQGLFVDEELFEIKPDDEPLF
ncbi:MAG TPA: hypothetical protein DCS93_42555 [Microscillaceae bacterium]|nr:hypothetical protein [Microscillaceae bacterium]